MKRREEEGRLEEIRKKENRIKGGGIIYVEEGMGQERGSRNFNELGAGNFDCD